MWLLLCSLRPAWTQRHFLSFEKELVFLIISVDFGRCTSLGCTAFLFCSMSTSILFIFLPLFVPLGQCRRLSGFPFSLDQVFLMIFFTPISVCTAMETSWFKPTQLFGLEEYWWIFPRPQMCSCLPIDLLCTSFGISPSSCTVWSLSACHNYLSMRILRSM